VKKLIREHYPFLIYLGYLIIIIIMIAAHSNGDTSERYMMVEDIPISDGWTYDYTNGITGTTSLPATLEEGGDSDMLILSRTLPKIDHQMSFIFRVRHAVVQTSIDHEVRASSAVSYSKTNYWNNIPGIYYQQLVVTPEDSGKEITIVSICDAKRYANTPGRVYLGDRATFVLQVLKDRLPTLLSAMTLGFMGILLMALWLATRLSMRQRVNEILCLALFCIDVALWLYTETDAVQFFMNDTGKATVMAYELLMVMPVPIAMFFAYYSDRERTKIHSRIAASIPLGIFIVNNVLHFTKTIHLADTLIISQGMLVVETLFVAVVQVREIQYKYKNDDKYSASLWKIPLIGIAVIVPLAAAEIVKYAFFPTKFTNSGILISLGVIFYMAAMAFDSIVRMNLRTRHYQQTSEVKTQFLANMSHEIRTPLNAILGFNEAILRTSKDDKVSHYAQNIQEAGNNLKSIINSILDISKIESGKIEIYEIEYSTVQMLDHLISMFEAMSQKKGLEFQVDIDGTLPEFLIGDENHISQILTNILSNAVKYTEEGLVRFTAKVLEVSTDTPTVKVRFSVEDTGIGIRQEDMGKLFEKFERFDREKNYSTEGTGLGMNIVFQLLKAMGSHIEVESIYGEGSVFYFDIVQSVTNRTEIGSFIEKRKQHALESSKGTDFIAPEARILIVDDVQMNIDAAEALLEELQIKIDSANSGKEAIEKIRRNEYDIVFMDHMMPEMDGVQATERIRQMAEEEENFYFAQLPIIALTANAMVGMREVFLQSGMQDFLSKPIEIDALNSVLKKWIPKNKIISISEVEKAAFAAELNAQSEVSDEWGALPDIVDVEVAKSFNPSFKVYEKNAKNYYNNYAATSSKLANFANSGNARDYTITVHGLKSTSKMIGLVSLSNMALWHEETSQGKKPEQAFVQLPEMLLYYKQCIDALGVSLGLAKAEAEDASDENAISSEEYEKIVVRVLDAANKFDMDAFMDLEDELEEICPPSDKKEEFAKIKELVANVSFSDVVELLG